MKDSHQTGDELYIDCDSSMGASSCRFAPITEIRIKYDPDNGQPYPQYRVDGEWYDGTDGSPITGPTAFYLRDDISK